jgi:transforming growth factor-beta-induced protein
VVTMTGNIVEAARENPELSTFVTALETAHLIDTLSDGGSFMVFAPTNDAFEALPADTLDALMANPQDLGQLLLYHIVGGAMPVAQAVAQPITPLFGPDLTLDLTADGLVVNDANAGVQAIEASNGVIYMIDEVLLPSVAEATAEASAEATADAEATAAP